VKTRKISARQQNAITAMIAARRPGVSHAAAPPSAGSLESTDRSSRRCAGPGSFRMARAISFRPRRSAIRMVAEFGLFVDFNSLVRSLAGTSSTDRYTWSDPAAEISTVETWNVPDETAIRCPQCGQRGVRLSIGLRQRVQVIYATTRALRPVPLV
jgi:hypothetical protein